MIPMDEAKAAITAAEEALSQNSGFSWIKKSALVERAYFLGLFSGLSAIAADDDLKPFDSILIKTLRYRKGDDTFPSTKVGQAFSSLRGKLRERPEPSNPSMIEYVANLREAIREDERFFQHHLRAIDDMFSRFSSSSEEPTLTNNDLRSEQQHRLLEALEPYLRIVALLETEHLLSNRLDE